MVNLIAAKFMDVKISDKIARFKISTFYTYFISTLVLDRLV